MQKKHLKMQKHEGRYVESENVQQLLQKEPTEEIRVKEMMHDYIPKLTKYTNSQLKGTQVLTEINKNKWLPRPIIIFKHNFKSTWKEKDYLQMNKNGTATDFPEINLQSVEEK